MTQIPNVRLDRALISLVQQRWTALEEQLPKRQWEQPGVYMLALTTRNLTDKQVRLRDVFYVGMSNSVGGVRQRLKQFWNAINKGYGHAGGDRLHRKYGPFSRWRSGKRFYVVALTFPCDSAKATRTPSDLRGMGQVACFEYYVLAHIKEHTGREPKWNER